MQIVKQQSRWFEKAPQIQIDSPRTLEACRQLGINPKEFKNKQKTYEDFAEKGVPEDIQKLKYKHYKTKHLDHIKLITSEREAIIRKAKKQLLPYSLSSYTGGDHSFSYLSSGSQIFPTSQKPEEYYKAIHYLRSSHKSPKIVDSSDIIPEINNGLNLYLENQIEKYNRVKQQIQKEALGIYENDLYRLKKASNIEMKMNKIDSVKQKFQEAKVILLFFLVQLLKGKIEKRALRRIDVKVATKEVDGLRAIKKFIKAKENERKSRVIIIDRKIISFFRNNNRQNYKEQDQKQRKEQSEKLKAKIDQANFIKQNIEEEDEKKFVNSYQLLEEKCNIAKKRKKEEQIQRLQNGKQLEGKIQEIQAKHYNLIKEKEKENFETLLHKLKKKSHSKTCFILLILLQIIELVKEDDTVNSSSLEKNYLEKAKQIRQQGAKQQKKKQQQYEEQLQKMEQKLDKLKKSQQYQTMLKSQKNQIRFSDFEQNHERIKRMNDVKVQALLEKELYYEYKIKELQRMKEIQLQAKIEAQLAKEAEKNRVFSGIQQVSNLLQSKQNLTKFDQTKGNKLLKSIVNYKHFKQDLNKISQEKKEAQKLEQQKSKANEANLEAMENLQKQKSS